MEETQEEEVPQQQPKQFDEFSPTPGLWNI
jgi:hypothetical protein